MGPAVVRGAELILDGRAVGDAWCVVDGDVIEEVGFGEPPDLPSADCMAWTIMPGFVDQHCHGGGGFDVGTDDQAARLVAAAHAEHGTTTLIASLVTAAPGALEDRVRALVPLVDEGVVAGIHLEGPWLSPAQCGAHDASLLRAPDAAEIETLLAAGAGRIRMATIAPELPGALTAIGRFVEAGVVVAIGHTDADFDLTCRAIDAGATVATHLLNRMPGLHKRHPGPAAALLESPNVFVELIADGVHLHPAMLQLAIAAAGPDRVCVVTDAMAAAAAADGGYRIGELDVTVEGGVARLVESGALAGSTLTMDQAMRVLTDSCAVALPQASQMLSSTPAAAMGLGDRGRIAPGYRADLVAVDDAQQAKLGRNLTDDAM